MDTRVMLGTAVATATTAAGLVLAPWLGSAPALSNAIAWGALAGMATLPAERRRHLGWLAGIPGIASLSVTAIVLSSGETIAEADLAVLEVAALLLLIIHTVRWHTGPSLWGVTALTVGAQVLWLLRYMPERDWLTMVGGCFFWSLGSAVAVVFGAYPRRAATRLRRSVDSAKQAQQRQLERDLHDYVAHDLSGIIVQAQAARYADADDPDQLAAALARIEETGRRAMSSMDRALSLLRDQEPAAPAELVRHPGLESLHALVERFNESATGAHAELTLFGDIAAVPREVSEVLYRSSVEGLTNVRRHGPSAGVTQMEARVETDQALIRITSPLSDTVAPTGRAAGGTGLQELRARIEPLRGTLTAGPTGQDWLLQVIIPFGTADI